MVRLKKFGIVLSLLATLFVGYKTIATISNTSTRTVTAVGTGATTNYTIGFVFQDNDQIRVFKKTVSTQAYVEVSYGAGATKFTITGGDPGTTVVMGTAPTTDEQLIIFRDTARTQTVDYDENSAFPADDHEETMDKIVQMIQELDFDLTTKIGLSTVSTSTAPVFPDPSANRFIVYDSGPSNLVALPSSAPSNGDVMQFNGTTWTTYDLATALSDVGSSAVLTAHIADLNNPHQVTAAQVGNGSSVWNANSILSVTIDDSAKADGYVLAYDSGTDRIIYQAAGVGIGDVVGPASATDNAIARYDLTTGKLIQDSSGTLSDLGVLGVSTVAATVAITGPDITASNSLTSSNLGAGGVTFAGTGGVLSGDSSYLFWDNTNKRLTVGVGNGENTLTVNGSSLGTTFGVHAEGGTDLAEVSTHRHSATAGYGAHFIGARSRGTEAAETVVQSGDTLVRHGAAGHDGTDYEEAARIDIQVDGTPGNNDMPGRIRFLTTPDGSTTPTEAMRISQDQSVTLAGNLDTNLTTTGPVISNSTGVLSSQSILTVVYGGTGVSTLTSNNVILGNGTDAVQFVAPGTSGNVLTSDGTTWTSAAPTGGSGGVGGSSTFAWSGYHDNSCSFARTNTSYGDFTADATCAFTERQNSNFGSVTSYVSGSDELPGIVFTPQTTGMYFVCAMTQAYGGSGTAAALRLTDGTTVIAETGWDDPGAGAITASHPICGVFNATSTSAKTLRLEGQINSGSVTIAPARSTHPIEWSIFYINSSDSDAVIARYTTSAGQTISDNTTTIIDFETPAIDTNSAVTTGGSWNFEAPVAGYYDVSAAIKFQSGNFGAANVKLMAYVGGSLHSYLGGHDPTNAALHTYVAGEDVIYLAGGSTLDIRVLQNSTTTMSLDTTAQYNRVMIKKVK